MSEREKHVEKFTSMGIVVTAEECVVGSLKVLGNHNECFGAFKHEILGMLFEICCSILPMSKVARVTKTFERMKENDQSCLRD